MIYFLIRRLLLLAVVTVSFISICTPSFAAAQQFKSDSIQERLAALESSAHGRIGISAINLANNMRLQYRAQERFPIQSTFKVMGVSAILKQSMTDNQLLQEKINYKKHDVIFWSPITTKYLVSGANGMTVSELCAAAVSYSDDTAINLLVKKLGGPAAVTAFARSIGDNAFRLDSWEPELNSNPRDLHDTSTPAAMEKSLQQLVLGNVLASPQRKLLETWMKGNTTGNARIRAGTPQGWIVADKTGSGEYGITNDIAIIWPPKSAPIVLAIYFIENKQYTAPRDDVIVEATRIVLNAFAHTDPNIKLQS